MSDAKSETRQDAAQGGSGFLALRPRAEVMDHAEAARTSQLVLEFESPAAAQLALPVPMRSRYTTYIIFSMFVALFLVALLFPIDRVVSGPGQIVTVHPQTGIAAYETGIVRSIDVHAGQVVHKGALLMTLDPTTANADVAAYTDQVASLTQEILRLQAELDGRTYLSDGTKHGEVQATLFARRHADITAQLASFDQQIAALKAQVQQAESDVLGYSQRLALSSEVEKKRKQLERLQVGSQLTTMSAADQRAEMQRARDAAKAQLEQMRSSLQSKISDRDATLENWRATTAQSLKDQRDKLYQAEDSLQRAKLSQRMVELRAPFDATVYQIAPTNTGTVVTVGTQLIQLTPLDSPLEYEMLVDGQNSGYVRPGQRATIKFDTFPYITHGTGTGKVRVMSSDSSQTPYNPITAPAGLSQSQQTFGTLYYKARVTMESLHLVGVPPDFKPVPGMQVTIDILVGRRTFLQYLFSRVIPTSTEAFREP
jgi:HlyD family type I secretion membrane fusion protein